MKRLKVQDTGTSELIGMLTSENSRRRRALFPSVQAHVSGMMMRSCGEVEIPFYKFCGEWVAADVGQNRRQSLLSGEFYKNAFC